MEWQLWRAAPVAELCTGERGKWRPQLWAHFSAPPQTRLKRQRRTLRMHSEVGLTTDAVKSASVSPHILPADSALRCSALLRTTPYPSTPLPPLAVPLVVAQPLSLISSLPSASCSSASPSGGRRLCAAVALALAVAVVVVLLPSVPCRR